MTNEEINLLSHENEDYVIACRRKIHQLAELGSQEFETSAFIEAQAKEMGLPVEKVGNTGLILTLDTGIEGAHIALRADIDALPMRENPENLKGARSCVSQNPETCHACGHDAHSAMLLGAAKALSQVKDKLTGVIYFCFEEAEEIGGGVLFMLEALSKRRVDTCWAIHVYSQLDSGKISLQGGARMAGAAGIQLTFIGRGGHGGRPDLSINPIFCASGFLNQLTSAFENQIDANQRVTLGVTMFKAGTNGNVIPDTAEIGGSMRFFDPAEGEKAVAIVKKTAEHVAAIHNCQVEYGPLMNVLCGPVINDPQLAELASSQLSQLLPEGSVTNCERWYASESYWRWLRKYRGILAFLGINNPQYGSGAAHHNDRFDVDEGVLSLGLAATLKYVLTYSENYDTLKTEVNNEI